MYVYIHTYIYSIYTVYTVYIFIYVYIYIYICGNLSFQILNFLSYKVYMPRH